MAPKMDDQLYILLLAMVNDIRVGWPSVYIVIN
jgi:hypothetical protein